MKRLQIFERALCCSTGVCGPSVDEDLLMITSIFELLEKNPEVEATRHNLSSDPKAFSQNEMIVTFMKENGRTCLPITVIDNKIVLSGKYPNLQELEQLLEIKIENNEEKKEKSSCCCSSC